MSETWAGNYFIRFINFNYRSNMERANTIQVMQDGMPYRVIGHWKAIDTTYGYKQGVIDYGFSTKEGAVNYLHNLMRIADGNSWSYTRKSDTQLSVTFAEWSNLKNFNGNYQVAKYINN